MGGENGWAELTLRDAGVSLIDCVHKTPPAADNGLPYVAIPQMRNGRIDTEGARLITKEHFDEWTKKALPRQNDVILSRRCNPGETAWVDPRLKCALGQNLVLLRADGEKVFPPFLRWLVRSREWWNEVGTFINVGAVFDSLRCADVPKFSLPIPPLAEQKAIAQILGTLDEKIELNRRMNETLEGIARAVFKSWFVDFDPVRAKLDGRQPAGMDPATAALFPDGFEDTELGKVPRGWRVGKLDDLLVLQRGFDLPKKDRHVGPYPVFAAGGYHGSHNEWKVQGPGIVTGRSGVIGNVFYVHEDHWPLNTTLWVKEFKRARPIYAFHYLQTLGLATYNSGSAVPTLNRNHIHGLPVEVPPENIVELYEARMGPVFKRIRHNEIESETLSTLRDTLLPKLLSGEIRVGEAAEMVGKG